MISHVFGGWLLWFGWPKWITKYDKWVMLTFRKINVKKYWKWIFFFLVFWTLNFTFLITVPYYFLYLLSHVTNFKKFLFQIENWAHFRGDLRPVRAQRNRFRQNRKKYWKSHDEWLVDIYNYWEKIAVDQKAIEVGTKPRTFLLKGTIVKNLKWAWDNNPEIWTKNIFLFGCSFEININLTQKAAFFD